MSNAIHKAGMTAFQRWEMASFNPPSVKPTPPQPVEPQPAQPLIDQEELEKIRQEAHSQGYQDGYATGFEKGSIDGYAKAYSDTRIETQPHVEALQKLIEHFSDELAFTSKQVGQEVLSLALALTEKLTQCHLAAHPESILPIVEDAIDHIHGDIQQGSLYLNPEDIKIVEENLGATLIKTGWRIIGDNNLSRGGCRLETKQNLVDASIETRWNKIAQLFKQVQTS